MNNTSPSHFSTHQVSSKLLNEIAEAIKDKYYGSVEIYIQDSKVTQITERVIKKLSDTATSRDNQKKQA